MLKISLALGPDEIDIRVDHDRCSRFFFFFHFAFFCFFKKSRALVIVDAYMNLIAAKGVVDNF